MLGFIQDDIPWLAVQDTRVAVGLISIQCIGDDVLTAKPWLMNIPCSTVHNASICLRFFAILKRVKEGMINRKLDTYPSGQEGRHSTIERSALWKQEALPPPVGAIIPTW